MATRDRHLVTSAWGALLQAHANVVPVIDGDLQRAVGLPFAWYDVLLELNAAPDKRLRMSDLGERVVLSRTRVSRLVAEMAIAGLVARESNPDDKRSSFATMTPAGSRRFREAAPVYLSLIEKHFASALSDAQLASLTTILGRVRDST